MTTKKTTSRKEPKTTRRTGTRRKSAERKPRKGTADGDAHTATSDAASTTTAAPAARAKPRGRRGARGEKPDSTAAPSAVSHPVVAPLSPAAQVEEVNGAIVIRFPPAAPPPFAPPPAPAAARSVAAPARPTAAPPERAREPEARATPPPPPPPPPRPAPAPVVAAEAPGPAPAPPAPATPPPVAPTVLTSDRPLSRSQKRRMRRKARRAGKEGPPMAGVSSDEPARPAAPPVRESGRPPRYEPAPPAETLTVGDFVESDPAPWLDDVEIGPADLDEADRREPEIIQPEGVEDVVGLEPGEAPETTAPEAVETEPVPGEEDRRRRRRGRRGARQQSPGAAPAAREARGEKAAPAPSRREMIINTIHREECRIAILENGRLEEIYLERATAENHVGNIYKGIVTNVEPSIQAAFIDFGQGKNGFLHISDLHPQYFPDGGGQTEDVGRKMPRRNRPPLQKCLRRGQEVLVQVTKEGIGTKGPTLSTYLSIPGRFLVMMPGMRRLGVSRRIEALDARDKLRAVLGDLELPEGMGFIARTAALDRSKRELQNDLSYLTRLWRTVERRIQNEPAPAELYRESDLVIRTIRDVFTNDIERIIVDDDEVLERARDFLSIFSPRSQDIVTKYTDPEPVFHKYGIEAELERLHSRHVPLRSGGSLVIDQTEALVAIDVNSGRFRTEDDAEATAYKINCEAADEIPRQLRLRDLGGVIVCDFIDMRIEAHRRDIERRLIENLKQHKERAKVLRTSAFGLIEMTRQRQRASLTRSVYRDCRHCRGTGLVKTPESVVLDVMRLLQLAVTREHIRTVEVLVSAEVAYMLQNRKRAWIHELEDKHRRSISIRPDPNFSLDEVSITCTDARGRIVPHT